MPDGCLPFVSALSWQVAFARGQLAPDTRRLLRQLGGSAGSGGGGGGGRRPAHTHISCLLPCDPEDASAAEAMLAHTGGRPSRCSAA